MHHRPQAQSHEPRFLAQVPAPDVAVPLGDAGDGDGADAGGARGRRAVASRAGGRGGAADYGRVGDAISADWGGGAEAVGAPSCVACVSGGLEDVLADVSEYHGGRLDYRGEEVCVLSSGKAEVSVGGLQGPSRFLSG